MPEGRAAVDEARAQSAPASSGRMQMRPYQVDCINAVLQELEQGHLTRLGVSAPTGKLGVPSSGKTAIFTELVHRLPPLINPLTSVKATQVLILVGSIVLANQAAEAVKRAYPDMRVEVEQGGKHVASGLEKFHPAMFKAVIIDEAHHAVAPSYLAILQRFDPRIESRVAQADQSRFNDELVANEIAPASSVHGPATETGELMPRRTPMQAQVDERGRPCVPLLAFTATWGRADGLALGKIFQKIVWHGEWLDMIKGSWLSQLRFTTVRLGDALDLSDVNVSKSTGEYVIASLARAVDKSQVNQLAVDAWFRKAEDRRSTLVFAVNIHHVVSLANAFREQGIDARFVHEGVRVQDREALYDAFRRGEFPVLVNCSILTEGADFPMIDCVLLVRPTRSKNLFLQMIGRGLRLSPSTGKRDCLILDLVGNTSQGLICTPTLFGLDPDDVVEGELTATLEQRAAAQAKHDQLELERDQASAARFDASGDLVIQDFASVFDLHAQIDRLPVSIERLSKLAWTSVGQDVWVLELSTRGHIKISYDKDTNQYRAIFYRRLTSMPSSRPFAKPTELCSHSSIEVLLRVTDAHVLQNSTLQAPVDVRRHAAWRREPVTEQQIGQIVRRLGSNGDDDRRVRVDAASATIMSLVTKGKRVEPGRRADEATIDGVWVPGRKWTDKVPVRSLTRGQASDLICRLKHGGKRVVDKARNRLEQQVKRRAKARNEVQGRREARRALGLE
ncbi:putative ATP-dependent helicase IRC3 [Microbotryomycetes sp. JL201]|nr:putative ATP-dependent helicase IRC3 [Microbotryomycetes sp. JL201]